MKPRRLIPGLLLAAMAAGLGPMRAAEEARGTPRFVFEQRAGGALAGRFTPEQLASALLAETNRVRAAHGRRPFKPQEALQAAADDHALTLALSARCEHFSPLYGQRDAGERARGHGLERGRVGENVLAMSPRADDRVPTCASLAADVVAQWMDSPGHRANLLNRDFVYFGGALRFGTPLGSAAERIYGVQVFATL